MGKEEKIIEILDLMLDAIQLADSEYSDEQWRLCSKIRTKIEELRNSLKK